MKTDLSVVNPVAAALALALCLWAATHDDGKFKPEAVLAGSISTYFVSKGLFVARHWFCWERSSVLVGKIVAWMMERAQK